MHLQYNILPSSLYILDIPVVLQIYEFMQGQLKHPIQTLLNQPHNFIILIFQDLMPHLQQHRLNYNRSK